MKLTIQLKLIAFGLLSASLLAVVGICGNYGLRAGKEGLRISNVAANSIQAASDGDMIHDAMRGDVLLSLHTLDEKETAELFAEVAEHTKTMREDHKTLDEQDLPQSIRDEHEQVKPLVDKYLAAVSRIVALATKDKVAGELELQGFLKLFHELEAVLDHFGKQIMEFSDSSREKADAMLVRARLLMFTAGGVAMVLLLGAALLVTRSIVKPIHACRDAIRKLAALDLTHTLTIGSTDEVGDMARDLEKAVLAIRTVMQQLAASAEQLKTSGGQLSSDSTMISANAEETSAQVNVVSAASEQVSKNVQTVATAAEEMTASIHEISKSASDAARVATNAVQVARQTNATISKLGESSDLIGNVVKVITSIAQQTNLLALNATIEAARAGEAGQGFAVVADEVKELAKETAKATEEISQRILAIRSDTKESISAIGQIGTIINQINDISSTIASAVEEQTATTNEITRNIGEAARGSSEIAQNITGVATAARSTSEGTVNASKSAAELLTLSSKLQEMVAQFKV